MAVIIEIYFYSCIIILNQILNSIFYDSIKDVQFFFFQHYSLTLIYFFIFIYVFSIIHIFILIFQLNSGFFKTLNYFSFFKNIPYFHFSLILLLLSLAGVPPLSGFFLKFLLFLLFTSKSHFFIIFFFTFINMFSIYFYIQNLLFVTSKKEFLISFSFFKNNLNKFFLKNNFNIITSIFFIFFLFFFVFLFDLPLNFLCFFSIWSLF